MAFEGFMIHHSSCASINGSGYDFWIGADGSVTPAPFSFIRIHPIARGKNFPGMNL